jgi:cation transport protein ChaC
VALTREQLENDHFRRTYRERYPELRIQSDEAFHGSLAETLAAHPAGTDAWVFGYGSLIWNPLFEFDARCPATVHGYHRRFCLWTRGNRGSPDAPGLVLALDRGGSCQGMAFRIPAVKLERELLMIWRREMVMGSYRPRWMRVRTAAGEVTALAFTIRRDHPNYAGKLPEAQVAATLATCRGFGGTGAEYLFETVDCLTRHGIHDPHLARLRERVARALHTGPEARIGCPEAGA